ncbi:phosphohistidine phosphatase SixA [Gilliamella sp. B2776]|uniref:phosphohistidine phosphatase SixA n=1 Tax=unclassified Gilliamella TaxID=2685620 RepID=UPI00226A93E3|nr:MULTISPECIES: phosphohistidine phosphatase SixA [unclassified Gilliamella]MCX8649393.1 phosphohistidine phosphatase SixA [Gilliamella sp. B2779]MCX8654746.1 phosphohistidine phosphatase SixA [Gilliamella sp. B2737]MCX8655766.1 phosphohistidine phosphatase SixA [Gilliamella sp. B2894]MCX8663868.1 phosphohistidine phosphatase SixA [Gilliamella sp. B2887]MCX8691112.1 phosphohistidine phosphatase SixA [Gilliamella sp. B2776]
MRHGEAGFSASSDSSRTLTDYGIEQSKKVGIWLKEQNFNFDLALVSPYLRAQQTLSGLSTYVHVTKVETEKCLVPSGSSSHIVDLIRVLLSNGLTNVIIVSHLPLVGYVVNELCPQVPPPMFPTAAIACIELTLDAVGKLEWFQQVQ